MRISNVRLQNFKRFTDLRVENIPASSKLVLLIGANGCGKSCVFDAFDYVNRVSNKGFPYGADESMEYYQKGSDKPLYIDIGIHGGEDIRLKSTGLETPLPESFKSIGRSAIRITPRLNSVGSAEVFQRDSDSPLSFVEPDSRFVNDFYGFMESIDYALREPTFRGESADTVKIFNERIAPFNESLLRIFGSDKRTSIQLENYSNVTPTKPAQLFFKKNGFRVNYSVLSHGEKQVVTLLLNFMVRKDYYENAVLLVDEMDNHLETALQERLLGEIVNRWIPDSSQLWTASHALGFINFANDSNQASIVDFDRLDFDSPQILVPTVKNDSDVYSIAIGEDIIEKLFQDRDIFYVENTDRDIYAQVLTNKRSLFVPAGNRDQVTAKTLDGHSHGIIDRDYLTNDDIQEIIGHYPRLRILRYYCIENYLFHPENLLEYHESIGSQFDRERYVSELISEKNAIISSLLGTIAMVRQSYTFFKEPNGNEESLQLSKRFKNSGSNTKQTEEIVRSLQSDDLETFYKSISMKDHFKGLRQRQNIDPTKLAKTSWFRLSIEAVVTIDRFN